MKKIINILVLPCLIVFSLSSCEQEEKDPYYKLSYDEMEEMIIIKTRQLARRQSQWFSKEKIDLIIEMDNMLKSQSSLIIHQLFKS